MNAINKADQVLDALGLQCPEPVMLARNALAGMPPGSVLAVLADDPLAELDFAVFCRRTGHELLGIENGDAGQRILIRRRADPPDRLSSD